MEHKNQWCSNETSIELGGLLCNDALVGGWPSPLKFPTYAKIRNVPNHQPLFWISGNQTWLAGKSLINGGFWLGKSLITGPFSIAMFDYQRVMMRNWTMKNTPIPSHFTGWIVRAVLQPEWLARCNLLLCFTNSYITCFYCQIVPSFLLWQDGLKSCCVGHPARLWAVGTVFEPCRSTEARRCWRKKHYGVIPSPWRFLRSKKCNPKYDLSHILKYRILKGKCILKAR